MNLANKNLLSDFMNFLFPYEGGDWKQSKIDTFSKQHAESKFLNRQPISGDLCYIEGFNYYFVVSHVKRKTCTVVDVHGVEKHKKNSQLKIVDTEKFNLMDVSCVEESSIVIFGNIKKIMSKGSFVVLGSASISDYDFLPYSRIK